MRIVLCYIIDGDNILLLKRSNDPYRGYWALPGGKVEEGESILGAAVREAEEESSLVFSAAAVRGSAFEEIIDSTFGNTVFSYEMFLVELIPQSADCIKSAEGELKWLSRKEFYRAADVVPTDIDLAEKFCMAKSTDYYHYTVVCSSDQEYWIEEIRKQ